MMAVRQSEESGDEKPDSDAFSHLEQTLAAQAPWCISLGFGSIVAAHPAAKGPRLAETQRQQT